MSFDLNSNEDSFKLKLSGLKHVSAFSSQELSFRYQPNFILIDAPSTKSSPALFGDILPFYSSYHELTSLIVTSWEALNDFILHSSTFATCLLSFFNQAVNSAAYQTYLTAIAGYEEVLALPDKYGFLKNKFSELVSTLSDADTRELWWIEVKIDIRRTLQKLTHLLETTWQVSQKFYLSILVFVCLGILNFAIPFTQSSPSSFLSSFVQNYSFSSSVSAMPEVSTTTPISTNAVGQTNSASSQVQKIIEHKVQDGDTIVKISEMYGLTPETIKVNNSLGDEDLKLDQKLYLPFADGYIVNLGDDTSAETLSTVSKVDKDTIIQENSAIYDSQNSKFLKGSLVLIPTKNVQSVSDAFKQEQERKSNEAKNAQAQKDRADNLSKKAVSGDTYRGQSSSDVRQVGFIWPTKGVITRCVQPGHIACDIANFSSPPIYAVQDGTISTVSYYDIAGYGLAVIIDHGNGVKTLYGHMSEIYVTKGQHVKQGDAIGRMGQTGWATGIHLHFEVIIDGVKQNPLLYLP